MLLEALEHFLTPCPKVWRELGYFREQIAIRARYRRNRSAWGPHLKASKEAILEASSQCEQKGKVVLIGAGLQYDLPLAELVEAFEKVLLVDLFFSPLLRWRLKRTYGERIQLLEADVTGAIETLYVEGGGVSDERLAGLFSSDMASPVLAAFKEADLVVSAGVASQLLLLPLEWLRRSRAIPKELEEQLMSQAVSSHYAQLKRLGRYRLLITDYIYRERSVRGDLVGTSSVMGMDGLGEPSHTWLWRVAPAPELSPELDIEHEVGVWKF